VNPLVTSRYTLRKSSSSQITCVRDKPVNDSMFVSASLGEWQIADRKEEWAKPGKGDRGRRIEFPETVTRPGVGCWIDPMRTGGYSRPGSSSRFVLIENSVDRLLIRQIDEGPHRS
jgi:hypothetical protein